jgi:hypothetical protein
MRVEAPFPERVEADLHEVQTRLLGPIFNHDGNLQMEYMRNAAPKGCNEGVFFLDP